MGSKAFKYELVFKDGIKFLSPDVRRNDPRWATESSKKPIRMLKFFLPSGQVLVMSGFEAYNFFVECSENLGGGGCMLEAFFFCGAHSGHVMVWKFDLRQKKVFRFLKRWGEEYAGTKTRGWRPGIFGEKPDALLMAEN